MNGNNNDPNPAVAQDQHQPNADDPSAQQHPAQVPHKKDEDHQSRKFLLFIFLAFLGIMLAIIIFSWTGKQKFVPPPPPKFPKRERQEAAPPAKPAVRPEDVPHYINGDLKGQQVLDQHKNVKDAFLGKEGAFNNYKVLVADFFELHEQGDFHATAGVELTRRGFNYTVVDDYDEFVYYSKYFDIIWLISSDEVDDDEDYGLFLDALDRLFNSKKNFFVWADNTPYVTTANIFLERFFNGMRVKGNYKGTRILTGARNGTTIGQFDANHKIAYGLNNIYEGNTVCHPINIHPDFKVFAYNTNNEPTILYAEANERHGRIILDCGFTKLYRDYWNLAGTHQYVSNANVWLTGIPQ